MKIALLFTLIFSSITLTQAQEGFSSFFADTTTANGSVSASMTPFIFETDTNAVILLSSSLQQAYEVSTDIINANPLVKQMKLNAVAYPNPTTTHLVLDIGEGQKKGWSYQLFNLNGTLLASKDITTIQTIISMSEYNSSLYILNVNYGENIIQSFKIVKI